MWKFRLLRADILLRQGHAEDVLRLLQDHPPQDANQNLAVRRLQILGLAYIRLGRSEEANQSIQEAWQICSRSDYAAQTQVTTAQGIFELSQDRPDHAQDIFRTSLQLADQQTDLFLKADVLLNLGTAAVRQEHFDEAIDWWNNSLAVAQAIGSEVHKEKVNGNLAWAYYKMGDFQRSLSLSLDAAKEAGEMGLVSDQVRWSNNIGMVYYQANEFSTADKYYQQSLELAKSIGDREQTIIALMSLAFTSVRTGQFDQAEKYRQQALEKAPGDRLAELYLLLSQGEADFQAGKLEESKKQLIDVVQDQRSDAFLKWQAQNDLARIYEQLGQADHAQHEYNAALNTLECARDSLAHEEFRLPFLTNASHVYDDYIRFLVNKKNDPLALQTADYSRAQTLAEGLNVLRKQENCVARPIPTINPFQAARKAGATVLFYWLGKEQSYLWAVTSQQSTLFKLPPSTQIDAMVQRYRKSLLDAADVSQAGNRDGIDLYKILVEPAERLIPHGSRVVIIPDQSLNNLNFETLLVSKPDLHYWIEDATIAYASSLKILSARRAPTSTRGKLLLIGDPVVPDPKYPHLPEAAVEIEKISATFPENAYRVYNRERATPIAYLNSSPEQYSYIHFVAHGTASQFSPLDSAIVLSKATGQADSFKLYARDIITRPLRADLVTISACYGSGSTVYNGEGLVGLSWGFIRAGAHNVIGALWAVSDKSTSQLMAQVYSELQKGRRPEDALRDAKLSLLHSDNVYRKPVYWGAFQFYVGP